MRFSLGSLLALLGLMAVAVPQTAAASTQQPDDDKSIAQAPDTVSDDIAADDQRIDLACVAVRPVHRAYLSIFFVSPELAKDVVSHADPLAVAPKTSPPA